MELILSLFRLKKSLESTRMDKKYSQKLSKFENLLEEYDDLDDKMACNKIYNNKNITNTYRSLKYRMEEKLLNDVFNICSSYDDFKSRTKTTLIVEKLTVIAYTLQKNSYRNDAIKLMEKILKISEKYYFTDTALKVLMPLLNHYSFVEPNNAKMKKYLEKTEYYTKVYTAEKYISNCNAIISHMYVVSKGGYSRKQIAYMERMVLEMNKLKKIYKSNSIYSFTNDLTYFYYESIGEYEKSLEIAIQSLKDALNLDNNDGFGIYQSKKNIAVSYFHLKQFDLATKYFKEVIPLLTPGSRVWFFLYSLYYLNLISIKNYNDLLQISLKVLKNKNIEKYSYFEELWKIREAYLHFLIRMGKIELTADDKTKIKSFSLSKFMNSVPFHSKDKSGQNITILVLQVLFLLEENKYGQIIDKIDSLTQYTYRYLRNDETFRSNCFIKMLLLMIKADFHPIRTRTYTEDLKKKLDASHLNTDERSSQVEIIPYDYLWELILEMLENKKLK